MRDDGGEKVVGWQRFLICVAPGHESTDSFSFACPLIMACCPSAPKKRKNQVARRMNNLLVKAAHASIFMICFIVGCTPEKRDPEQVSGLYMWKHQDGRLEVWSIEPNYQFEQRFYQDLAAYNNQRAFFTYHHSWSFVPGKARPVLSFRRSCTLIDLGTDRALDVPEEITGQSAGWEHAAENRVPYLDFFADKGYIAYRIIDELK